MLTAVTVGAVKIEILNSERVSPVNRERELGRSFEISGKKLYGRCRVVNGIEMSENRVTSTCQNLTAAVGIGGTGGRGGEMKPASRPESFPKAPCRFG